MLELGLGSPWGFRIYHLEIKGRTSRPVRRGLGKALSGTPTVLRGSVSSDLTVPRDARAAVVGLGMLARSGGFVHGGPGSPTSCE